MAGDAFKKVQPGQRLKITAEAFNAFVDAARAVREHTGFDTEEFILLRPPISI
jgi:hypothetical protein